MEVGAMMFIHWMSEYEAYQAGDRLPYTAMEDMSLKERRLLGLWRKEVEKIKQGRSSDMRWTRAMLAQDSLPQAELILRCQFVDSLFLMGKWLAKYKR